MRFQLKNFGSLREVDLEIPGLTVLTGENGTGKRTLCRAFFTLVDSLGGCNAKPTGAQREAVYKVVEDFYLKWQDVENQSEFELRGIDRRLEWAALKYGVTDTNRWYIAERTEDGCVVRHVTGRQCEIYDSLAQPYQTIEDEAMRRDKWNGESGNL